jgi:hypothetical protein
VGPLAMDDQAVVDPEGRSLGRGAWGAGALAATLVAGTPDSGRLDFRKRQSV